MADAKRNSSSKAGILIHRLLKGGGLSWSRCSTHVNGDWFATHSLHVSLRQQHDAHSEKWTRSGAMTSQKSALLNKLNDNLLFLVCQGKIAHSTFQRLLQFFVHVNLPISVTLVDLTTISSTSIAVWHVCMDAWESLWIARMRGDKFRGMSDSHTTKTT